MKQKTKKTLFVPVTSHVYWTPLGSLFSFPSVFMWTIHVSVTINQHEFTKRFFCSLLPLCLLWEVLKLHSDVQFQPVHSMPAPRLHVNTQKQIRRQAFDTWQLLEMSTSVRLSPFPSLYLSLLLSSSL